MRTLLIVVGLVALSCAAFAQDYTTNYATPSGSIDHWGVWKADGANGQQWNLYEPAGALLRNNIAVSADVEIWERDTLNADNVVFHFGRTADANLVAQPISQVLTGTVQSNNDCTIDIWTTCASIQALKYKSGFAGSGADIPLTWEYKLASQDDSAYASCTYPDGPAKAVAWPSGFGAGSAVNQTFNIRVTATPQALQADGSYALDPTISVTPVL